MYKDPQDYIPSAAPDNIKKKMIVVPEQQRFEDDFRPPSLFYIIDCFGNAVFFKTRSRAKAQEMSDVVYGKQFYLVKQVMFAITR